MCVNKVELLNYSGCMNVQQMNGYSETCDKSHEKQEIIPIALRG